MENDIVERAARAAWEANRTRCAVEIPDLKDWDEETEQLREDWRAFARAAIQSVQADYCDAASEALSATWLFMSQRFEVRPNWRLLRPAANAVFFQRLVSGLQLPR